MAFLGDLAVIKECRFKIVTKQLKFADYTQYKNVNQHFFIKKNLF